MISISHSPSISQLSGFDRAHQRISPWIKVTHHKDIHRRMQEAEQMLGIVRHQYDILAETFRKMVHMPVNKDRLDLYLSRVFPGFATTEVNTGAAPVFQRDRAWSEYFFD